MSNGNVCSRRVHDGYATIRSRGRPRAVYRSDSEELLKEAGGPYALPCLSNFRVVGEDVRQVPRWADLGRNQPPIENYGTLRVGKSRDLEESRRVTLETFSKNAFREQKSGSNGSSRNDARQACDDLQPAKESKVCGNRSKNHRADVNLCDNYGRESKVYARYGWKELCADDRRVCETVPTRNDLATLKPFCVVGRATRENRPDIGSERLGIRDNSRAISRDKSSLGKRSLKSPRDNRLSENDGDSSGSTIIRDPRNVKNDVTRCSNSTSRNDLESTKRETSKDRGLPIYAVPNAFAKSRRERRMVVSDGNYVPSGDLYRTTAKYIEDINRNLAEIDKSYEQLKANPRTYGMISKIAKDDPSRNLFGYTRKRDMAPMPPIVVSTDVDDTAVEEKSDNGYLRKPNSRGKLPPKVLPRSSSIENTSRHSTGSTTASSSKSTESLYAISESLTELPNTGTCQPRNSSRRGDSQRLSEPRCGRDAPIERTSGSADVKRDDQAESAGTKDETSSTDDDPSGSGPRLLERSSVTSAIRRNRSRVDRETVDGKRISVKREQTRSLEDRLKDRRCGTLPSRKPRVSSRPLHKSSEDILDGERTSDDRPHLQQRSCSSTADVSHGLSVDEDLTQVRRGPVYTADATEMILKRQMERSACITGQPRDYFSMRRTLEHEKREDKVRYDGFATLPRRGNLTKDQPDPIRRFSGNAPVLEPLYEHAVSDPAKPRGIQNVIPWWELATRKYRHRSCPSLQVNWVRSDGSRQLGIADRCAEIAVAPRFVASLGQ